jgi:hypothetical protein
MSQQYKMFTYLVIQLVSAMAWATEFSSLQLVHSADQVSYLPTQLQVVDTSGKAINSPQIMAFGNKALITGHLSLIALPTEVDQLREQFAGKVVEIKPKAFAMWLLVDNEIIWQRPMSGGER